MEKEGRVPAPMPEYRSAGCSLAFPAAVQGSSFLPSLECLTSAVAWGMGTDETWVSNSVSGNLKPLPQFPLLSNGMATLWLYLLGG